MSIEVFDLILIAFLSGIGNAIGQPIGKWIWKRMNKHKKILEEYLPKKKV
jgi:hypothetical protein